MGERQFMLFVVAETKQAPEGVQETNALDDTGDCKSAVGERHLAEHNTEQRSILL